MLEGKVTRFRATPGPETAAGDGILSHPEEIRCEVDLRLGDKVGVHARLRTTPAGLISAGIMVSAAILALAAVVRTAHRRIG